MDASDELVRLKLMEMRGVKLETQADVIRGLGDAGFPAPRIAELLGTSLGTVSVTLARWKKAKGKKAEDEGARDE